MAAKPSSTVVRYARIWWRASALAFANAAASRLDFISYVIGKLVRMGFFLLFAEALFTNAPTIAGYTKGEVLLFFAIMNLIDVLVQMIWFRGMTNFQSDIRTGDFDFTLTKPISPLWWTAFNLFDFFDLTTVPAAALFLWYAFHELQHPLTHQQIFLGIGMLIVSLVVAFGATLCFAAGSFWTTELDNAWWLYRYTVYVARFPPSIFPHAVQWIFTYLLPILVIVVFPTKAFLGQLSLPGFAWAVAAAVLWLIIAVTFWKRGLHRYESASS